MSKIDRRSFLTYSSVLLAAGVCRSVAAPPDSTIESLCGRFLTPFYARRDFSGVVAVQSPRATIIFRIGDDKYPAGVPLNTETRFGIESISKLLTLECLTSLQNAGKLAFDDALEKWIAGFPNGRAITLRMLLEHTSGLARDLDADLLDKTKSHTTAELVEACKRAEPAGKPGAGFNYSNNGYRVLARVAELASGSDFADVVKKRVLEPLDMSSTCEWGMGDAVPNLASGFQPGKRWAEVALAPRVHMSNYRGAASYCSTVSDLLKLAAAQQTAAISSSAKPRSGTGHDGKGHGYMGMCYRYPAEQTSIVCLSNIESGLFDELKSGLEQIVFESRLPAVDIPSSAAIAGPISADFLGNYDLFGGRLVLGRARDKTYFVDAGDGPVPLISIGPNVLFSRLLYATLRREVTDDGVALAWSQPSGKFLLKKRD